MGSIGLSGIYYIYKARLQARAVLVQEVFAILGIAVGVALLFSSQVASSSLAHSEAKINTQLIRGAQVQLDARGPEGVRERLLAQVRGMPGVRVALPIMERQVNVIGPSGERAVDLIGINPQLVRASGRLLRRFSLAQVATLHAVALPTPLAREIGTDSLESVNVQVGIRFVKTFVGATLDSRAIGGLLHSPIAVATMRYAQQLAGMPGRISRIFVRMDPSRERETRHQLARLAAAWGVNLVPGGFDSQLFAVAIAPETKSEALFSGISALVGFMFALNAMLITVPSRRKLIEDLRPHGATSLMTVEILLFDAIVMGVCACVLGLILGDVLSIAVFNATPSYLAFAFPIGNSRIITWQSVAIAVGAGMTAAIVGVLWPVREIIANPLQRPSQTARHRRATTAALLVAGLACLGVTTFTLTSDIRASVVGNITLIMALVCLLPFVFDGLVVVCRYLAGVLDEVGAKLAVIELATPQTRVRSLAIAATAALAVFGVVEFQGTQANLEKGLQSSLSGTDSNADVWVLPRGRSSLQPTVPFDPINVARLERLPGVGRISVYRGSFLNWGDRRLWVLAPGSDVQRPVPADQVVQGNPDRASLLVRQGNWAVLSQALAEEHHLRVGDTFVLPSPQPSTFRVAALTTNLGWPPGAIILNSAAYAQAWGDSNPSAYEIQTTPGASTPAVRDALRHALRVDPGLAVETARERRQRHYAVASQGLSRLTQIRLLIMIAATLAVVGTIGAMIWQRRDLIASMKCHGYREIVLWRWLLYEALILLAAGSAAGAVFGLYAQILGSHFLAIVTGFPITFNLEGAAAITSGALVSVGAIATLAIPGYLVVRVQPRTVSPAY